MEPGGVKDKSPASVSGERWTRRPACLVGYIIGSVLVGSAVSLKKTPLALGRSIIIAGGLVAGDEVYCFDLTGSDSISLDKRRMFLCLGGIYR